MLTDETTNRKVLTWLKSWDSVLKLDLPKLNLAPPEIQKKQEPFYFKKQNQMTYENEFSIQNKQILLLYGPPGTGKSTMARVLASQCGFTPKSINASDVRNGTDLTMIIRNALEMNDISI